MSPAGADAQVSEFPSIFAALVQQLGLGLRASETTLDAIVIDQIERLIPD